MPFHAVCIMDDYIRKLEQAPRRMHTSITIYICYRRKHPRGDILGITSPYKHYQMTAKYEPFGNGSRG